MTPLETHNHVDLLTSGNPCACIGTRLTRRFAAHNRNKFVDEQTRLIQQHESRMMQRDREQAELNQMAAQAKRQSDKEATKESLLDKAKRGGFRNKRPSVLASLGLTP